MMVEGVERVVRVFRVAETAKSIRVVQCHWEAFHRSRCHNDIEARFAAEPRNAPGPLTIILRETPGLLPVILQTWITGTPRATGASASTA